MPAVVKTLIQPRPVGKELLLANNIPFLDRNHEHAFKTRFQEDFKPISSKKAEPVCQPAPAQVDHKDLRHIKEYLTETRASYHGHQLPQMTRTPRWTTLYTNFKMQKDPREIAFLSTQSEKYQPQPFQPPPNPTRPPDAFKKVQQAENSPVSATKASFTLQHGSPVARAKAKHLEEGFPTIKGDGHHDCYITHYNKIFDGAWSRAAPPVEKHISKVTMGDPGKIIERGTTQATSFSWPTVCRPSVVKERLKLNLGQYSKDSWSSTSSDAFCDYNQRDPVVLTKMDQYSSSLPKGDTDTRRNKERMSVTLNRISFPDLNQTKRPVFVPGSEIMTTSHVKFSQPRLSSLYYSTTAKEHYSKQNGEQARPATQLPSNILNGPEHEWKLSTAKTDYIPLKTSRQSPCVSQQTTNFRFPLDQEHFSTTHKEHYTAKPLILRRPVKTQLFTNFVMQ